MALCVPRCHIKASFSEKGDFLSQALREGHNCDFCAPSGNWETLESLVPDLVEMWSASSANPWER